MDQTSSSRVASLDLLRLISALAVVLYHYLFRGAAADNFLATSYPEVAGYALAGDYGVCLFFIISGFVIAWSAEGRSWVEFATARITRLYPGFIICMTFTFLVLVVANAAAFPVSIGQYLANLTMFAPAFGQKFMDGAYWSIVLEVIFYGWVFLALVTGVFEKYKIEIIIGWLAIMILNEFVIVSKMLRLLFLTQYGPYFAAGILIHHMSRRGPSKLPTLLLAVSFVLACINSRISQEWMLGHYGTALSTNGTVLANMVVFALMLLAVRFHHLVPNTSLVFALGGITYPLYLLHQNIGYVTIDALAPSIGKWAAFSVTLAGMLLLSWLVWRFAETPMRRMMRNALNQLTSRILRLRPAAAQ